VLILTFICQDRPFIYNNKADLKFHEIDFEHCPSHGPYGGRILLSVYCSKREISGVILLWVNQVTNVDPNRCLSLAVRASSPVLHSNHSVRGALTPGWRQYATVIYTKAHCIALLIRCGNYGLRQFLRR
jgi:hypothetical protein